MTSRDASSRRSVLRNGALVSGALVLGSSILPGSATAGGHGNTKNGKTKNGNAASGKNGGVAYVPAKPKALEGARFRIGQRLQQRLKHTASCRGSGERKEYVAYSLLPPATGKTAPAPVMYVNPDRNINTGSTAVYQFHNADACDGTTGGQQGTAVVSQANFRPTK